MKTILITDNLCWIKSETSLELLILSKKLL